MRGKKAKIRNKTRVRNTPPTVGYANPLYKGNKHLGTQDHRVLLQRLGVIPPQELIDELERKEKEENA